MNALGPYVVEARLRFRLYVELVLEGAGGWRIKLEDPQRWTLDDVRQAAIVDLEARFPRKDVESDHVYRRRVLREFRAQLETEARGNDERRSGRGVRMAYSGPRREG